MFIKREKDCLLNPEGLFKIYEKTNYFIFLCFTFNKVL